MNEITMQRFLFAMFLSFTFLTAASAQQLVGTYKLMSFTSNFSDGTTVQPLGKLPNGYAIITPKRFMSVLVSDTRKPGTTPDDKLALYSSLIAYTGPYTIEGEKLITAVDVSWNQGWTGIKQVRTFTIEGNRLTTVTDSAPSALEPGKTVSARVVWEKIE